MGLLGSPGYYEGPHLDPPRPRPVPHVQGSEISAPYSCTLISAVATDHRYAFSPDCRSVVANRQ